MKKLLLISVLIVVSACGNKDILEWEKNFEKVRCDDNYANGLYVDVDVKRYSTYEGHDYIQVKTMDGNTLVLSTNRCVLSKK